MEYKSDVGVMEYGVGAGPHALTYAGGNNYTYDANGNMVKGKNKEMAYDPENRLIKVEEGSKITEFSYDGDGGRVSQVTRNQDTETRTIYIGALFEITQISAEGKTQMSADGETQRTQTKHIFAGANRVCSLKTTVSLREGDEVSDEAISYYHSDHLGSSNVLSDATGAKQASYEYEPYGKVTQQTGEDATSHKFTGKELDSTGLYYYGARYYDPEIGRFITADSIVQSPYDPQSLNRYSYCRNNPINYVDPSGHSWKSFWKSFAKALGSGVAGGIVTALLFPIMGPFAFMVGGAIAGASNAALNGAGWQGILTGAAMGAVLGGGLGGLACAGHGLAAGLIGGGLVLGGGIHTYQQGGWEGVGDYAGAVIGGTIGFGAGAKIGAGLGKAMSGSQGQQSKTTQAKVALEPEQKPSYTNTKIVWRKTETTYYQEGDGVRYVGPEEAKYVQLNNGEVPNTIAGSNKVKPIFYTVDEPIMSASQAQQQYNLPVKPTHAVIVETIEVTNIYASSPVEGGGQGTTELITYQKMQAKAIIE